MDIESFAIGMKVGAKNGGGGGGVLVVTPDPETWVLDKTWQEIYDATASGQVVVIFDVGEDYSALYYVTGVNDASALSLGYTVDAMTIAGGAFSPNKWVADSASGYPEVNED